MFGGTSPFGVKTKMPVYAEKTIFDLSKIYINGGKRGFLISINPQGFTGRFKCRESRNRNQRLETARQNL